MSSRFQIEPLLAFKDNYIWALRSGSCAAVVDPGDARPVLDYLSRERLQLVAVLATHHHPDHVGGVVEIKRHHDVPVYGPKHDPIPALTYPLVEGDRVALPELGREFEVLDCPGHTRAPIAYYGSKLLFCGDTLFACGCGRLFEGTPQQMCASLAKFAALPEDTLVYCAHEYTLANIRFARAVEPGNAALAAREQVEARVRSENRPTVPSTIGRERATNPFLRCTQAEVAQSASRYRKTSISDPVEVFAAIREWKNKF